VRQAGLGEDTHRQLMDPMLAVWQELTLTPEAMLLLRIAITLNPASRSEFWAGVTGDAAAYFSWVEGLPLSVPNTPSSLPPSPSLLFPAQPSP
jgi:hypothetical protein